MRIEMNEIACRNVESDRQVESTRATSLQLYNPIYKSSTFQQTGYREKPAATLTTDLINAKKIYLISSPAIIRIYIFGNRHA